MEIRDYSYFFYPMVQTYSEGESFSADGTRLPCGIKIDFKAATDITPETIEKIVKIIGNRLAILSVDSISFETAHNYCSHEGCQPRFCKEHLTDAETLETKELEEKLLKEEFRLGVLSSATMLGRFDRGDVATMRVVLAKVQEFVATLTLASTSS